VTTFTEKDFYLDEFRGRTLVIAIDRTSVERTRARRRLADVATELVSNGSRLVVVLGELGPNGGPVDPAAAREIRRWIGLALSRARRQRSRLASTESSLRGDTIVWDGDHVERSLGHVWQVLRLRPQCVVLSNDRALDAACVIAARLRAHKLVTIESAGGLVDDAHQLPFSFLDLERLRVLLLAGEAEFQGLSGRRHTLGKLAAALSSGVGSVNLCDVDGLARELFTYEGSGTLLTRGDYCVVERLAVEDFHEVERLIERGQKEGLLKVRTVEEIGELLLNGYGAWIGHRHLAGIGALRREPYRDDRAAEVSGLYTLTRFKGEGIGESLVKRLVADTRDEGLAYLFAVTTADRAAAFFLRSGFHEVGADQVPGAKWRDYDPARRARVRIFRLDLARK
jgi:N-acetylglutamate synthase-like GNAT family acetyltransferase